MVIVGSVVVVECVIEVCKVCGVKCVMVLLVSGSVVMVIRLVRVLLVCC